jgi:hypothetical protein
MNKIGTIYAGLAKDALRPVERVMQSSVPR